MAIPVHPGRIIKRELKARRISGHKLALDLGIPPDRIEQLFGTQLDGISMETAESIRAALDEAKGQLAFGEQWKGNLVQATMLWQLGFWRIAQLREQGRSLESVLEPGRYPHVVVFIADLCSFRSYVHDTRDPDVARMALLSEEADA